MMFQSVLASLQFQCNRLTWANTNFTLGDFMRRFTSWTLKVLLALVVAGGAAAAYYRENLVRLYHVNTLFDEEVIVSNFGSMKDLFKWTPVKRSGDIAPWFDSKRDLAQSYNFGGEPKLVADWLEQTRTTSLLVIQDGRIAFEDYRLGTKPEDMRISWSMAKSFLSAMFGTAVADGRIKSLDDPG